MGGTDLMDKAVNNLEIGNKKQKVEVGYFYMLLAGVILDIYSNTGHSLRFQLISSLAPLYVSWGTKVSIVGKRNVGSIDSCGFSGVSV